jgi:hypothetical protein
MFMRNLLAVAVATAVSLPAQAVTITEWDLTGTPGSQASTAAFGAAANVTGSALTRGAGLSGNAGANSINASGWSGQATDYFEFGFTVASGYTVDLSELFIGTRSSATGPGTVGLFYSGNGFSTALTTFNQAPGANFVNTLFNFSGLTGLTGSVNFRVMQVGTAAANGGATNTTSGTFRIADYFVGGIETSNLKLTGSVNSVVAPIPVPAAVWLFGSALAGVAGVSRRKAA